MKDFLPAAAFVCAIFLPDYWNLAPGFRESLIGPLHAIASLAPSLAIATLLTIVLVNTYRLQRPARRIK